MRKKVKANKNRTLAVAFAVIGIVFIIVLLDIRIKDSFDELSEFCCEQSASEIIYSSVDEVLERTGAEYSDLAVPVYDEKGRIVSVDIISKNVNKIQSMTVESINRRLAERDCSDVEISLGTASGFYLLNGRGPDIKVKFIPVGNVRTRLYSQFSSAGINQTCHKIVMEISVNCSAIYPGGKTESTVTMSSILAETVIVGEIPQSVIELDSPV